MVQRVVQIIKENGTSSKMLLIVCAATFTHALFVSAMHRNAHTFNPRGRATCSFLFENTHNSCFEVFLKI
jgi:hypothetical protein